jgi:hypothetical protein
MLRFQTAMHAQSHRADRSQVQMEAAARTAIELRAGRALTDAQWAAARTRLIEFAGTLRDWDRKTTASRRGNVELLCQPEPGFIAKIRFAGNEARVEGLDLEV